jgi:hypothetical protein
MKKNLENESSHIKFLFNKKKFYFKFKNIVLTTSDGYDSTTFAIYSTWIGNLILTYLICPIYKIQDKQFRNNSFLSSKNNSN